MEKVISANILRIVPSLLTLPQSHYTVDYDEEVDVLYISFHRPQRATNSVMTPEGLLLRYRDDQLVGVTILDASTRT